MRLPKTGLLLAFVARFGIFFRHVTKSKTKRAHRRCAWCKRRFQASPRGRPPRFCSRSCRQRAYEERRATHPRALLRQDLNSIAVKDEIRRLVNEALEAAGILAVVPPPEPKRRGRLRIVHDPEESAE